MSAKAVSEPPQERGPDRGVGARFAQAFVIGVAYYLAARLGYAFAIRPANVAVVWPPSGLLLGLLLVLDRRARPYALAGALVAGVAADMQTGASLLVAMAGSAVNCTESVVAAALLLRLIGQRMTLGSLREVGALVLGAAVASNAATALVGALVITHGAFTHYWRAWFVWWTGDGMGMLMFTPAVLAVAEVMRTRPRVRVERAIEALVLLGAVGALAQVLLTAHQWSAVIGGPAFMVFPLLIAIALRFGPRGAASATLVLCSVTAWKAAHVSGLFGNSGASSMGEVLDMYSYLALASLSALVPAAMLNERTMVERELRQSEQRFREMAEHIKEAFVIVDLSAGTPLYTSPGWADIWGRPIEDAQDWRNWFDTIYPDDRAMVLESNAAVKRGESNTMVFRIMRPDGALRWLRARVFPVRDETGAVYRLAGMSEDITDLRRAEEQLAQAQKMDAVGRLAGGVAHDFNNLLTVILNYSDLLLLELPSDDPKRGDIASIRDAGESAARLTRQLLTFSRREVLQPQALQVNEVITTTGTMLTRLIGEHIDLVIALEAHADTVLADPGQLEQLVVNLAVNAHDAMPDGGRMLIESRNVEFPDGITDYGVAHRAGSYVMLAVSDSGTGMDDVTRARIFEPFFTTKGRGKGTGLGLSTAYGIVRQCGGFFSVYSEQGKGSAFKVYLPQHVAANPGASLVAAPVQSPRGTETILVVEDDAAVRGIVFDVLQRQGYQVLAVSDGAAALEVERRTEGVIDLLLTDVIMPGMNGRALADLFAPLRPSARILFVSGYTDDAISRHGILDAGVQYLEKPFTAATLSRKVREVLDG